MTATVLRLRIGAEWPQRPIAEWIRLDGSGRIADGGTGGPDDWPAADEHEAILGAGQAVWLRAGLPDRIPRGQFGPLLSSALEDRLLHEPASQHFTVTGRGPGEALVLVVARARLAAIAGAFAQLGRPLTRLWSELQTVPGGDYRWHVTLEHGRAIVRPPDGAAIVVDQPADANVPTAALALVLATRGRADGDTPSLILHRRSPDGIDHQAWANALGMDVQTGTAGAWHDGVDRADNLLHGEFAPRHRRRAWLARLRPALLVAATAAASDLILGAGEVAWRHRQIAELRKSSVQLLRSASPRAPAIDPAAQLRRYYDTRAAAAGRLGGDDLLALLADVAQSADEVAWSELQALNYRDGRLELTLDEGQAGHAQALARSLTGRGIDARIVDAGNGRWRLVIGEARRS